jgi:DNA-binding MarR family transcriptional regulator
MSSLATHRAIAALDVPVPHALSQRADLLICRLSGAVSRMTAEALAPLGINAGHHSVLRMLADEGPLSQQALADALRIDRSTMVGLVDDLEKAGRVRRRRNPDDRRAYLVELTGDGRKLLRQADKRALAAQESIFAPLPPGEREEFVRLIGVLLEGGHLPGFRRSP